MNTFQIHRLAYLMVLVTSASLSVISAIRHQDLRMFIFFAGYSLGALLYPDKVRK
jgi:hypothetical protein